MLKTLHVNYISYFIAPYCFVPDTLLFKIKKNIYLSFVVVYLPEYLKIVLYIYTLLYPLVLCQLHECDPHLAHLLFDFASAHYF